MFSRSDYSILETRNDAIYMDSTYAFDHTKGFTVAAAVTYGDESFNFEEEDPEIGQLKYFIKHWAASTEGVKFRELKSRKCLPEDFEFQPGHKRSNYGFYPFDKDTEGNFEVVKDRFKCIDEPFELKGHYDSQSAQNLMVVFEVCDPTKRKKCKSPEVIRKALQFSYILLVENNEFYKHQETTGSEEMILHEANLKWFALSTDLK